VKVAADNGAPLRICRRPSDWAQTVYRAEPPHRAALTIGIFDGIHLGHQHIFRRVAEAARGATPTLVPAAVTFDPHPLRVLRPEQAPPLIATLEQRLAGFQQHGLAAALVLNFDLGLSRLSPDDFVRTILVEQLRAACVLVGENFRFGHRQAGDVAKLTALGRQFNFTVEIVPPVRLHGEVVSSTAIRTAVQQGDVGRAAQLLGQLFTLTGKIQPGAGRGRTVLFPTLNLAPQQELLPKTGVYVTETEVGGERYRSATNVGYRPTVDSTATRITIESHLLDFDQPVTSGAIEVAFLHRLRDEMKFGGVDSLRAQIASDLAATRDYFAAHRSR
jgi:riboflavin kinase/FMN adenylyltransferase